jgi:hypothetical protein
LILKKLKLEKRIYFKKRIEVNNKIFKLIIPGIDLKKIKSNKFKIVEVKNLKNLRKLETIFFLDQSQSKF